MNREIKFRVWEIMSSRWANWDEIGITASKNADITTFRPDWRDTRKEFDIMQFTGLKDRIGKDIYEGDIIDWIADEHYIVKYSPIHAKFDTCGMRGNEETRDLLTKGLAQELTVVGNIYENPELL